MANYLERFPDEVPKPEGYLVQGEREELPLWSHDQLADWLRFRLRRVDPMNVNLVTMAEAARAAGYSGLDELVQSLLNASRPESSSSDPTPSPDA